MRGRFQPYAGKTTTWDMEGGSFHYLSIDLKPTLPDQDWQTFVFSRVKRSRRVVYLMQAQLCLLPGDRVEAAMRG